MMGVTPVQKRMLDAIRKLTVDGIAPTYAELRDELGMASAGTVKQRLDALRERGLITFLPHKARSIRILGEMEGLAARSTDDLHALRARIDAILKGRAQ